MRVVFVAALLVVLAVPPVVGSAAGAAALAPRPAPSAALFPWVPVGGFPNAFPFGQCTWWAAYNHPVTWNGNAGDWLANARAAGITTDDSPTVGAIAIFRPGGEYSRYGHVAIVIAVGSKSYEVSEMNAPQWGQVTTRRLGWPDGAVAGFIRLAAPDPR